MALDIVALALDFISAYGLVAIFVLLVLDGALLLPVFPGEIVLIMAVATYAPDTAGLLFLILLTSVAGLLGSLLLYAITRGGGRRLVERYPRFFMMPRRRRERLERSFQRPAGQSLVLFLRLFPLTRVLVSIPAGLAKMPLVRYVVMSTIGLTLYHAGFLWFAFEARRPDSTIATQTAQLKQAYASPAWNFVEANAVLSGAVLVLLGAVLSVRASRAMVRDPEESAGSLIGNLATAALFWGGIALAVGTYMDPDTVYALIQVGGVDIQEVAVRLDSGPLQILWGTAAVSILLGYSVTRYRRAAQEKRKQELAIQKALAIKEAQKPGPIVFHAHSEAVSASDEPWLESDEEVMDADLQPTRFTKVDAPVAEPVSDEATDGPDLDWGNPESKEGPRPAED